MRGGAASVVWWFLRCGEDGGRRRKLELELGPSMAARRRAAREGRGELGRGSGVRRLKEGSEARRSPLKSAAEGVDPWARSVGRTPPATRRTRVGKTGSTDGRAPLAGDSGKREKEMCFLLHCISQF